jgi:putative ABC transport system permease protein
MEQKKVGRFGRPINNSIHNVEEWLEYHEVIRQDVKVLLGLALLFLVVCLLSSVSLLLTKFTSRTPEMSLRRALGANRAQIVQQNLTEVALLGVAGGVLGIALTQLSLVAIRSGMDDYAPAALFELDWVMLGTAIFVAITTSLLAGIYPAIRAGFIAPAHQLKTQ